MKNVKERNGSFLPETSNGLMNLLRLKFGHIVVIGVDQQFHFVDKEGAREYLGELYGSGKISIQTTDQIMRAVNGSGMVNSLADVVKRVDQYNLVDDNRGRRIFRMCGTNNHGHFNLPDGNSLNSVLESAANPIKSFEGALHKLINLVDDDRVKAIDAVAALKQVRAARLPIVHQAATDDLELMFDIVSSDLFGHGLDDLLRATAGRSPMEYGYGDPRRSERNSPPTPEARNNGAGASDQTQV